MVVIPSFGGAAAGGQGRDDSGKVREGVFDPETRRKIREWRSAHECHEDPIAVFRASGNWERVFSERSAQNRAAASTM
jgi:L-rhamnose isomerase